MRLWYCRDLDIAASVLAISFPAVYNTLQATDPFVLYMSLGLCIG